VRSYLDEIDCPTVQERLDVFWHGAVIDRPLIAITCPAPPPHPHPPTAPDELLAAWTDPEYMLRSAEHEMESTVYLGEALPILVPNLGPDCFAAFLGAELTFLDSHTTWAKPFVEDLASWKPRLDPHNPWWQAMQRLLEAACEAAEGRFLVGMPDLHTGGDALAACRHPDRLALDLYDHPTELKRLMRELLPVAISVCDDYFSKAQRVQEGSTTWLRAYSRGRYTVLQNDFSGLCGPRMFEEFFLEDIRQMARYLDNSIYHLDGPSALANLPLLLELEELDAIQWVPGAGSKPMAQWTDVLKRIQQAGKGLTIDCAPNEVLPILRELRPEGVLIFTQCASEEEGRALLRQVSALA